MTIKIGINGMGRIGRMIVRSIIETQNRNLKIQHINNRSNAETTCKLLKYDSIHGKFNAELKFDENELIINENKITFSQESKIENINWKKYDVDYVFECTGKFNSKEKLITHIKNGAKKVIVSAPCKNADKTIVFGVNENIISNDDISSLDIIFSFTPKTIVLSAFLHGAETITFFAPFLMCVINFSFELNLPVHSKT